MISHINIPLQLNIRKNRGVQHNLKNKKKNCWINGKFWHNHCILLYLPVSIFFSFFVRFFSVIRGLKRYCGVKLLYFLLIFNQKNKKMFSNFIENLQISFTLLNNVYFVYFQLWYLWSNIHPVHTNGDA